MAEGFKIRFWRTVLSHRDYGEDKHRDGRAAIIRSVSDGGNLGLANHNHICWKSSTDLGWCFHGSGRCGQRVGRGQEEGGVLRRC